MISTADMRKGKLILDLGTEKKQCFDDYENESLIMNDKILWKLSNFCPDCGAKIGNGRWEMTENGGG